MAKGKDQQGARLISGDAPAPITLGKGVYVRELERLQVELVKLQYWIKERGLKVVVIFEGRDAAGKGGVIKRITESLNPRHTREIGRASCRERV